MSKITNDGLTRFGRHRMLFSCTHMATVGRQRVIVSTDQCSVINRTGLEWTWSQSIIDVHASCHRLSHSSSV